MSISRILYIIVILTILIEHATAQSIFTESGYTSLTIRLSGKFPKKFPLGNPGINNVLSKKPAEVKQINDSTYLLSDYTFGPMTVFTSLNNQNLMTILLPNHADLLEIHYIDSTNYKIDYQGYFKEMFDKSNQLSELISKSYEYRSPTKSKEEAQAIFKTANSYRDARLDGMRRLTDEISQNVNVDMVNKYYTNSYTDFLKTIYLTDNYNNAIQNYYQALGLDSIIQPLVIPTRDLSYYEGIITPIHADTSSLTHTGYHMILSSIIKDSLLDLPSIVEEGPNAYHSKLKMQFGQIFKQDHNLFYDMAIAIAYMEQIRNGNLLSYKNQHELIQYFKNAHISNYILYQNDFYKLKFDKKVNGKYHLPFDPTKDLVMEDILIKYKGKVIVVDFWATWCGPCIAAFEEIKDLKVQYSAQNDVVFIYITDETSDFKLWNDYVQNLSGEHYYLYNNQSAALYNKYGIKYIPSYLIFNKKGELSNANVGGYMGNEKTKSWINKALTE